MRKISTVVAAAALMGGAFVLTATPASAECLTYTGTTNPIVTVQGPYGPNTVYAPGDVDVDPADCYKTVVDLVGA
ncbi:MAG TPA: hypothetical protein VNQ77_02015 [Frankiaceae bacterium]|nr:hypothetical protein [Frankiaceae bacterium]